MMKTAHLGEAGPHPVIASAARELLNKSDNERSGVLSTAMSFLGLYRDPVVAEVTRRCDWRIDDLVDAARPTSLYLVVPPSDISRTRPLIRLMLNQIGRRLTEDLKPASERHELLIMFDEFPSEGRLDFFESSVAFMAGYKIKCFLIAQSLNQIEKAYGPNNAILDNCHVRVSFASNDERTAKRISDALGTATEMRAMKNYAGHRLSPWLGHLMVSRSETARQLLTPGEVMQLPPDAEIVMAAGVHPIRAKKSRAVKDRRFTERVMPPPDPKAGVGRPRPDDWSALQPIAAPPMPDPPADEAPKKPKKKKAGKKKSDADADATNADLRREPEIERHVDIAPPPRPAPANEFELDEPDTDAARQATVRRHMQNMAQQASLDPDDGIEL
jgi:type IV secretion system protein VirD4